MKALFGVTLGGGLVALGIIILRFRRPIGTMLSKAPLNRTLHGEDGALRQGVWAALILGTISVVEGLCLLVILALSYLD